MRSRRLWNWLARRRDRSNPREAPPIMSLPNGVEILCLTCLCAIRYSEFSPAIICNCPAGNHTAIAVSERGFHQESRAKFATYDE